MTKIIFSLFDTLWAISFLYPQNSPTFSKLLNLDLPDQIIKDDNTFNIFAGKTVL